MEIVAGGVGTVLLMHLKVEVIEIEVKEDVHREVIGTRILDEIVMDHPVIIAEGVVQEVSQPIPMHLHTLEIAETLENALMSQEVLAVQVGSIRFLTK